MIGKSSVLLAAPLLLAPLLMAMPPGAHAATLPGSPPSNFALPDNILSSGDFDRMHEAAARLYQNRKIGDVETWAGPDSHDSGSVHLLRSFQTKGMACSRLQYDIRFGTPREMQSYRLNWCKTAGGPWMIEDYTPPD